MKKTWAGISTLCLLFVAILLTGCGNKKEETKDSYAESAAKVEEKSSEAKADNTVAAEEDAASQDVAPDEDVLAADQDVEEETSTAKAAKEETRLHPVYMGVWGNVGGTGFNFDMDGTTGSYIPYDFGEAKEYGARRQLKLVSYNPKDGRCVINAFLQGKYIGQFDGIFEEEEIETDDHGTHYLQAYNGIFTSVKGAKLDFHFHFD